MAVVFPNQPIAISEGTASGVRVKPDQLFPIVEGFFGPLRVPLPRTSAVLDATYGKRWRTKYAVRSIDGKYRCILGPLDRHAIHPAVPLSGCPSYLGCFRGAGLDASAGDVVWRWLPNAAASGATGSPRAVADDGDKKASDNN